MLEILEGRSPLKVDKQGLVYFMEYDVLARIIAVLSIIGGLIMAYMLAFTEYEPNWFTQYIAIMAFMMIFVIPRIIVRNHPTKNYSAMTKKF